MPSTRHSATGVSRGWGLDELAGLSLSVSVLTRPVEMQCTDEADLLAQLRPGTDGLIIRAPGQAALFLPSVWEEIGEPDVFLSALKQKAGMREGALPSGFVAQRFRSIEVKGAIEASGSIGVLAEPDQTLGWRLVPA